MDKQWLVDNLRCIVLMSGKGQRDHCCLHVDNEVVCFYLDKKPVVHREEILSTRIHLYLFGVDLKKQKGHRAYLGLVHLFDD